MTLRSPPDSISRRPATGQLRPGALVVAGLFSWGYNRIDVFARATSANVLHHKWWNGTDWNTGWEDLGGSLASAPAVSSDGSGSLAVYARGTANDMREKTRSSSGWSGWGSRGGTLTTAPAAVSWASGRTDAFAFSTGGSCGRRFTASATGRTGRRFPTPTRPYR